MSYIVKASILQFGLSDDDPVWTFGSFSKRERADNFVELILENVLGDYYKESDKQAENGSILSVWVETLTPGTQYREIDEITQAWKRELTNARLTEDDE